MMKECLNCGNKSDYLLCPECRTDEKFTRIFQSMMRFNPEDCPSESLRKYMENFEDPMQARDTVPGILSLLDADLSEYYFCRYYWQMRDDRFEEAAVCYIDSHDIADVKTQQVLCDLLSLYSRNDFVKPEKWCLMISEIPDLYCELYYHAAQFFAMTGEYDLADRIIDHALSLCTDDLYDKFLTYSREGEIQSLNKLKIDNERYRTKRPYWPNTEERRNQVAAVYEKKGIPIPGSVKKNASKKKKVKESDFKPIQEFLGDVPEQYCTFWCSEAFAVVAAKGIYQIAAVKVSHGEVTDCFQSYIRPWDGTASITASAKEAGIDFNVLNKADRVTDVMKAFFEFVGNDVLVSTDALGKQAKLISRAARYALMEKIDNQFFDILDYAADISEEFDLKNNTRSYLEGYFGLTEGNDALEKAEINFEIMKKLKEMEMS